MTALSPRVVVAFTGLTGRVDLARAVLSVSIWCERFAVSFGAAELG